MCPIPDFSIYSSRDSAMPAAHGPTMLPAPDPTMLIEPDQTHLSEAILTRLSHCENIILTAPPGYGKESMVKKIAFNLTEQHKEFQVCFMDLLSVTSKVSFLELLKNTVLKFANPGEFEQFQSSSSKNDLIALPEHLAKRKRIKLLICIYNIQNLARFKDSDKLLKQLRFMSRKQNNCVYLLSGHNRELMISIFRDPLNAMTSFGRLYTLDTPKLDSLETSVRAYFFNSGKRITPAAARLICSFTRNHTFTAQLLTSHSWLRTSFLCTEQIVRESLQGLIFQFRLQYQVILNKLSIRQINYLRALLIQAQGFCSREKLLEYELGRSSNVCRIRNSLIKREIIYSFHGETFIIDPLLEYWLAYYYFAEPR